MEMTARFLVTLEALDENDNPVTVRLSDGFYLDEERNYWNPVLYEPTLYRAGLYAGDAVPAQRSGYGEIVLANIDGRMEYLSNYAVDGRLCTVFQRAAEGELTLLFRGTVSLIKTSKETVSIILRDPQELLKDTHPRTNYAGDNVLPMGLEGVETDLKGNAKPRVYGSISNATPTLVNTALVIYQISDLPCTVTSVYDGGIPLEYEGDYVDLNQLQALDQTPSAGKYRRFQGYIRLGAQPSGRLTVNANSGQNLGDVVDALCADVDQPFCQTCRSELNALGPCALLLGNDVSTMSLLDDLAKSSLCYWRVDSSGKVLMNPLPTPYLELVTWTVSAELILDIDRVSTGGGSNGLPVYEVVVEGDPVEVVQDDLFGAADLEHAARVSKKHRTYRATNAATRVRHPLSLPYETESKLVSFSSLESIAQRLLDLLSTRRDVLKVTIPLKEFQETQVTDSIALIYPKLGYNTPKAFIVLDYELDSANNQVRMTLWG